LAAVAESWRSLHVPWRAPLRAAHPVPPDSGGRELELLTLSDGAGQVGYGEAAPLAGYAGASPAGARAAARNMAALDLQGRTAGQPVWRLLGAGAARPVAVNATIGADPPAVAAALARAAVEHGFRTLKVKVGLGDDIGRVAAVREAAGPAAAIRLDANGAWDVTTAIEHLRALAEFGIELCEEPVHGAAALTAVAAALPSVTIAADESAAELLAPESLAPESLAAGPRAGGRGAAMPVDTVHPGASAPGSVRAVCLKVARGGITALVRDAARARAQGLDVYLASTLDGPLGIAAALHAAAVIAPARACGLATLDRFDREPPFTAQSGFMLPPAGPGLGDGLIDWYLR